MEATPTAKLPAKRWKIVLKQTVLTVVLLLVVWLAVFIFLTSYSIYHPKPFDQKRFDQIVTDIQSGKLKANGSIVILPPGLAGVSVTGRAYVTDGAVFVPSWMGRHQLVCVGFCDACDESAEGYLYSSTPYQTNSFTEDGPTNLPRFCKPWQAGNDSSAQSMEIFVQGQMRKKWYRVISGNLPPCL